MKGTNNVESWQIFYNQKSIAQFYGPGLHRSVPIRKASIQPDDVISVRFNSDSPSDDAITTLYTIGNNNKVLLTHGKGTPNPLTISLKEVLRLADLYHTSKLNIYYRDDRRDQQIFTLILK